MSTDSDRPDDDRSRGAADPSGQPDGLADDARLADATQGDGPLDRPDVTGEATSNGSGSSPLARSRAEDAAPDGGLGRDADGVDRDGLEPDGIGSGDDGAVVDGAERETASVGASPVRSVPAGTAVTAGSARAAARRSAARAGVTDSKAAATPARTQAAAPARGNVFARLQRFLREVVAELRKVIWPTRKQMITYTIVVIVFVVFMVALVAGLDVLFARAVLAVFG